MVSIEAMGCILFAVAWFVGGPLCMRRAWRLQAIVDGEEWSSQTARDAMVTGVMMAPIGVVMCVIMSLWYTPCRLERQSQTGQLDKWQREAVAAAYADLSDYVLSEQFAQRRYEEAT